MSWILDPAGRILAGALDGLAHRQALVAANVANIDTPGYAPRSLDFESALRAELDGSRSEAADRRPPTSGPDAGLALRRTDPRHLLGDPGVSSQPSPAVTPFEGSLRNDGNRVDVDSEMAALAADQLRFSSVSRLMTAKLAMLREASRER